jgi:general secretion pathway protein A
MFTKFYGLTQNPFDISPDPRFYYPTQRHNEALASLSYGIGRRKGFIVLTGEVGTGKTLLVRYLLETLIRSNVQYAYVFNPRLSPDDFLHYVLADFNVTPPNQNRSEMLQQFSRFLIDVHRRGSTAALLIDEAHLLTHDLLEEIRLLTNLETSRHKLLQIVLVGQPELDLILDSPDLRQLKQRIALRCRLQPLSEADVSGYIAKRLQIAGGTNGMMAEVFPPATVARILHYSRGIPRIINTVCDSAMLNAYAHRQKKVTPEQIEEVANDLRLKQRTESPATLSMEQQPDRKMVLRTLMRLAQMLEPMESAGEDFTHSPRQGVKGQ